MYRGDLRWHERGARDPQRGPDRSGRGITAKYPWPRYTPASALGTCRFKLKRDQEYERILQVFEAHNIRYFFYCRGNDSQDTADKISKLAQSKGYALRVIGVPKTIDNDLVTTDHCPGYGSVVKYLCSVVQESALDHEAMGQHDLVSIIEVMGRNAGWIAWYYSGQRKENPNDAPHLIYLPELPFSKDKFIDDVQAVLKKNRFCMIVVGEGLVDKDGNYVANSASGQDAFGHQQLGGIGDFLANFCEQNLTVKAAHASLVLGSVQPLIAHLKQIMTKHSWQVRLRFVLQSMVRPIKWLFWFVEKVRLIPAKLDLLLFLKSPTG